MPNPTPADIARHRLGIGRPIITGPDDPIIGRGNAERRLRWRYRQILKQHGGRPLLELWR